VTDTPADGHPIWTARNAEGLSREAVVRLLDPPVSTKTLERWEKRVTPVPRHRIRQLAQIYRTKVGDLVNAAHA
jgi:DNA-binding transcriptional regulator YiaG